jgi:hypothetical protein
MGDKAPFNVFISSTYRDLKEEREKVIEVVDKVCNAIGMEKFLPDEKSTLKVCLEYLEKCNIYIGIIGSSYGSIIPEDQLKEVEGENYEKYKGLSFTHYEFRKAGELGIPRAVFILDKETEIEELGKFKEEIKNSVSPTYFSNLDELIEKVENSLRGRIPEWVFEGKLRIPGFFGRENELRELYENLTDEKQIFSVINVFGVGGIGKTALIEALLLLLSVKGYLTWEVRSTEGRETTFSTPRNYKIDVLKFPDVRGLAQLLGIELKGDVEDSIINWLDENKAALFIDDFQKFEDNFKDFINKAHDKLKNGRIIVASRRPANIRCHLYRELLKMEEKPFKEMIKNELKNASIEPYEEIVEAIHEKTSGHPLAVKMLIPIIRRYKLSIEELNRFGSIKNVQNEDEIKEFISRTFLENVKNKQDLTVFKYLSLLKYGFNYNILKAVLALLKDKRCKWENEKLLREFLSQYMPHIISYDYKREIFNFSHDMVKEAAYSQVENIEKFREEILVVLLAIMVEIRKTLKEIEEKGILAIKEEDVSVFEEILYQAEEIMKLKGENKELVKVALESSCILSEYGYLGRIPLMTYEFGRKALYYAEILENWIKALDMAEHMLYYAGVLLIPEDDVRSLYMKVDKLFPEALKLNEDDARYYYAFAMSRWAFYSLFSLNNVREAELSLEKAFKEIGSRDSRKIIDELLWHDAYSNLLTTKSDVLIMKRDFKEALKVLKENDELLEHYKDKIIRMGGEEVYYKSKYIFMERLRHLTLLTAESENDLERARKYAENYITYVSKAESKKYSISRGIVNLAKIQMLLAKNQYDFKEVYRDLEDCFKTFEEVGDKHDEALTKRFMAICCLALKHDSDALKFAEESMEIVKKGPNEYLKAVHELTLAYVKITSRLSDFKRGKISNEVYELIRSAYERLENRKLINGVIVLAVEMIAKYLQNKIKYDELLNELDRFAETLKIGKYILGSWVIKQFMNTVKEKGDIDEDILRLKGIKLLLAI